MEIKFCINLIVAINKLSCPRYKLQRKPSFCFPFCPFIRFTPAKLFNRLIQILLIHLFESNALRSNIQHPKVKPIFHSKGLEFPPAGSFFLLYIFEEVLSEGSRCFFCKYLRGVRLIKRGREYSRKGLKVLRGWPRDRE